ncbi:hypothetical protein NRA45_18655 [Acinetobacter baumannii]|nr:hypothetical protein [Acinetobacter baumannii]
MTFDLVSALTGAVSPIAGKNIGMGIADSLTFGGASAIKNSLAEIKNLADQSNDNLFYWQIKTFLDTASDDLSEDEVTSFLSSHPQGYRLGAEIFKILESTYIEKQAELIAIAFRQRVKKIISDDQFHEYVHVISQLNHHLIAVIEGDLSDIKRYFSTRESDKNIELSQDDFLQCKVDYSLEHALNILGFVEEEPQYINLEPDYDGRPKTAIDLEKEYRRTGIYFGFYSQIYQFSKLETE